MRLNVFNTALVAASLALVHTADAQVTPVKPLTILAEAGVERDGYIPDSFGDPALGKDGTVLVHIHGTDATLGLAASGYFLMNTEGMTRIYPQNEIWVTVDGVEEDAGSGDAAQALSDAGDAVFWVQDRGFHYYKDGSFTWLVREGTTDPEGNVFSGLQEQAYMTGSGYIGIVGDTHSWVFNPDGTVRTIISGRTLVGVANSGVAAVHENHGTFYRVDGDTQERLLGVDDVSTFPFPERVTTIGSHTFTPGGTLALMVEVMDPSLTECEPDGSGCSSSVWSFRSGTTEKAIGVLGGRVIGQGTLDLRSGMTTGPADYYGIKGHVDIDDHSDPKRGPIAYRHDNLGPSDAVFQAGDNLGGYTILMESIWTLQPTVGGALAEILVDPGDGNGTGAVIYADFFGVNAGSGALVAEEHTVTFSDGTVRTIQKSGIILRPALTAGRAQMVNERGDAVFRIFTEEAGGEAGGTLVFMGEPPPVRSPETGADLAVSATASADGALITYDISVTNNGPKEVSDYTLELPLVEELSQAGELPEHCERTKTALVCNEDSVVGAVLAPAEAKTFRYQVQASSSGTYAGIVKVSTDSAADPDSSNNEVPVSVDVTVRGTADLSVSIRESVGRYTATVTNAGPDDVDAAVLTLSMSSGGWGNLLTLAQGFTCTFPDGLTIRCEVAAIAAGGSLETPLIEKPPGDITAEVTSAWNDPDLSNNTTTITAPTPTGCEATSESPWASFPAMFLFLALWIRARRRTVAASRVSARV